MAMKTLEYLRGISADDCRRLRAMGIRHTNQLLHLVTLEIDRRRLSAKAGISADRLLEFGHQCALLEISGLEHHLAVTRRLGIVALQDLRRADAGRLREALMEAVGPDAAPTVAMVQYWISQARMCDCIEIPITSAARPSLPAAR